jgi:site-specific DNA-methyltransferase (adenine-specific)
MTAPGSRYRLFLGDCLDVLAQLPDNSVDALITDPPFSMAGGISNGRSSVVDTQFFAFWWRAVAEELNRVMKPESEGFIWCDWRTAAIIADGFKPKHQSYDAMAVTQMIYHNRRMIGQGKPFRNSVDTIAYVRGPKSTGRRIPNDTPNLIERYWYYGKHPHHPAEKSVEVCVQLLDWCSDAGSVVLDPFMGGGTVGVACASTGRQFIGIERDADYYQVAETRIAEAYTASQHTGGVLPPTRLSLFSLVEENAQEEEV